MSKTDNSQPSETEAAPQSELVSVFNRGGGAFIHGEYRLDPGEVREVPKEIADLWLSHGGANPRVVLAKDRSASAPAAPDPKLVAENAELKAAQAISDARIKALEEQLAAAQGGQVPQVAPKTKSEKSKTS